MPEEFLNELVEKTTSVTIREFTPEGVRVSYNLQGQVKGQYEANHMETTDALLKPDGTATFEARAIEQTKEGDLIMIRAKGNARQVSPTSVHIEGEASFQTPSKTLDWLNAAKGRFEGVIDLPTGELTAKSFAQR